MSDSKKNDKGVMLDFPDQVRIAVEDDDQSQDFLESLEDYMNIWDDPGEDYLDEMRDRRERNRVLHIDEDDEIFDSLKDDDPAEMESDKINLRNMKFRDILSIPLPSPLEKRTMAQYAVAVLVAFICILLSIYYKEISFLVGIVISGYLVFQAISTSIDFANGQICEIPVVCTHATESKMKNKTQVTFRTGDEDPIFYQFDVPGNKANEFQINMVYVIYFNINNPRVLMTYTSA